MSTCYAGIYLGISLFVAVSTLCGTLCVHFASHSVCIIPGYFQTLFASACIFSSVPLLKMPPQQREPRAPPRPFVFPSPCPHSAESKPPSRWNVCHNKSISRRWSNAFERLCVLVRGGLRKHTGMSCARLRWNRTAESAHESLGWLTWARLVCLL